MGSPISTIVAKQFMEKFEIKAISTATNLPRIWFRYVDDAFIIQKAEHSQQFLQHINSIDPHIHIPAEDPNSDGSLPFLDTLVTPAPDNTLLKTVYRKLTHIDSTFTGTGTTIVLVSVLYSASLHIELGLMCKSTTIAQGIEAHKGSLM